MKRVLSLVMVCAMMLAMLAGCTPAEKPTEPTTPNTPTEPTKPTEPAKPDANKKIRTDIVSAEPSDIVTFDVWSCTDSYSNKVINMVYDTLVDLDAEGLPIAGLAEKWEEISTTEIKFTIRKDVKFHEGQTLSLDDVVYSLERIKANPISAAGLEQVTEIIKNDADHSVTLKLSAPYAPLYVNLTEVYGHIMNKEWAEAQGTEGIKTKANGTGPFKLDYWRPNDECKVVSFDEHWAGKPVATSVRLRVIPETTSRTVMLETGEVDTVTPIAAIDIKRVQDNPKLRTMEMPASSVIYLCFNTVNEKFKNKDVRQAFQYAIDKESIIQVVYEGYALPGVSPFPTIMPSFDETLKDKYTFDLEKAKALLASGGYPNGFEMEVCTSSDERQKAAQVMQADFEKIGVKLDISQMEFGTLMEYCNKEDGWDSFILGWGHATNQDRTMTNNFHSSMFGASGNRARYSNPEVDKLIEQGRTELEWSKREAIYKQAQQIIMEDSPWIPIWQQINVYGFNAGLKDLEVYSRGTVVYTNAYIEE